MVRTHRNSDEDGKNSGMLHDQSTVTNQIEQRGDPLPRVARSLNSGKRALKDDRTVGEFSNDLKPRAMSKRIHRVQRSNETTTVPVAEEETTGSNRSAQVKEEEHQDSVDLERLGRIPEGPEEINECQEYTEEEKEKNVAFCCYICTCSDKRKAKVDDFANDAFVQSGAGGLFHRRCCHKQYVLPPDFHWKPVFEAASFQWEENLVNEELKAPEWPKSMDKALRRRIMEESTTYSNDLKKAYTDKNNGANCACARLQRFGRGLTCIAYFLRHHQAVLSSSEYNTARLQFRKLPNANRPAVVLVCTAA
jgi:hypothetical protein